MSAIKAFYSRMDIDEAVREYSIYSNKHDPWSNLLATVEMVLHDEYDHFIPDKYDHQDHVSLKRVGFESQDAAKRQRRIPARLVDSVGENSDDAMSVDTETKLMSDHRRGPRGKSKYKGVCVTRAGKWRAVIYIERKQNYLGVFDSEEEAARAYNEKEREAFPNRPPTNDV